MSSATSDDRDASDSVSRRSFLLMSRASTEAPAFARTRDVARPIPDPAPVTTARRPFRLTTLTSDSWTIATLLCLPVNLHPAQANTRTCYHKTLCYFGGYCRERSTLRLWRMVVLRVT